MTNRITDISERQAAVIAGLGLLLMCLLAPVAFFSVLQNLVVAGDTQTTFSNIVASESLFRTSIVLLLLVVILDIVVAWGLYVLLKPVNKSLSLLTACFRLVYAAIFAAALANLHDVLQLLNGSEYLSIFEPDQIHTQVTLLIESFYNEWSIGLAIFGFHLLLLGLLVFKSNSRVLGILVVLAGTGYIVDSYGKILMSDYSLTLGLYTFFGEILLIFWLFWIGIKGVPATLERA